MIKLNKLVLFAACGVPACIGMAYMFRKRVSTDIKNGKVYIEALDMLRQHKGAIYFLGQPISDLTAKFDNTGWNDEGRRNVKVNVVGPKTDGVLYISVLPDKEQKLQVDSVHLQVGKDDTKRLVIKKSLNELNSNS